MVDIMSAGQAKSNKQIAGLTVGEYKSRITTTKGGVVGLSMAAIEEKQLQQFFYSLYILRGFDFHRTT